MKLIYPPCPPELPRWATKTTLSCRAGPQGLQALGSEPGLMQGCGWVLPRGRSIAVISSLWAFIVVRSLHCIFKSNSFYIISINANSKNNFWDENGGMNKLQSRRFGNAASLPAAESHPSLWHLTGPQPAPACNTLLLLSLAVALLWQHCPFSFPAPGRWEAVPQLFLVSAACVAVSLLPAMGVLLILKMPVWCVWMKAQLCAKELCLSGRASRC